MSNCLKNFIKEFSKKGLQLITEAELHKLDSFALFLHASIFQDNLLFQFEDCINLTELPESEWADIINMYLSVNDAVSFILVKRIDESSRLLYIFHLSRLVSSYLVDGEISGLPKETDKEEAIKHLSIHNSLPIIH